jgi:hypothetical protein
LDELGEPLKTAVVSPLDGIRKATGRKLAHVEVVTEAFAAKTLPGTALIAAIAGARVLGFLAFHKLNQRQNRERIT